jgi:flagellar basal-body rod protein FlgB
VSVFPVGDATMSTIYQAMQGYSATQQATAQNIANINTPGYKAQQVDFVTSLNNAIADGDPESSSIDVTSSTAPAQLNGNNVNLSDEEVQATKTSLGFSTMVQAMNYKFNLLSTAISGQANGA